MYGLYIILYALLITGWEITMNKYFSSNFPNLTIEKKIKIIIILIAHHIISFFLFFGIFLLLNGIIKKTKYIYTYIFFNLAIVFHWKTNNNRCKFTEFQNEILNIDENLGFRNLHNIILNNYPHNIRDSSRDYFFHFIVMMNILFSIKILFFSN